MSNLIGQKFNNCVSLIKRDKKICSILTLLLTFIKFWPSIVVYTSLILKYIHCMQTVHTRFRQLLFQLSAQDLHRLSLDGLGFSFFSSLNRFKEDKAFFEYKNESLVCGLAVVYINVPSWDIPVYWEWWCSITSG